jgi:hypothetical protein
MGTKFSLEFVGERAGNWTPFAASHLIDLYPDSQNSEKNISCDILL